MSYLVLARKWRPQTFDEVVGQPHVTKTLRNAISSNRVAHAYLFTGARGVGKTSVARILAKNLNCETETPHRPCNSCSNCREITQGNAVDVLEIDGASNRGIDSIRELRETVRYRPAKSRHKIYIIDEVHMLTTEAFNALLKTLEEPPAHVIFVFATTEPHKIPATILSRCQRFDFRRIPISLLVKHLKEVAAQEKREFSEAVFYAVAREADGSMRDAQSLFEQLLAFSADGLSDTEVLDVLGVVDRRVVHEVSRAVMAGDVRACLAAVEDLYRRGTDSKRFCQHLCDHFRNLLFLSLAGGEGDVPWLDMPEEERAALRLEASGVTPESLYLYFQMVVKGEEELRRSSLPRVALEMLLVRLTQLPRLESMEKLVERLSNLESALSAGPGLDVAEETPAALRHEPAGRTGRKSVGKPRPAVTAAPEETGEVVESAAVPMGPEAAEAMLPPSEPAPSGPVDVEGMWPSFLRWLKDRDPILEAKLTQSSVAMRGQDTVELEVMELYEDTLKGPESVANLHNAAGAYFGRSFEWSIRSRSSARGDGKGPTGPRARKSDSRINAKRAVLENPIVQAAIEILGGELIDIRRLKG